MNLPGKLCKICGRSKDEHGLGVAHEFTEVYSPKHTITLPNGYNGDTVECECKPLEYDGGCYKLKVAGEENYIRWVSVVDWQRLMYEKFYDEVLIAMDTKIQGLQEQAEMMREYQDYLKMKKNDKQKGE